MKVLVNAVACRVAGGRSVALNFLRCCRDGDFPHEWVVQAPAGCGYEDVAGGSVRVHLAPDWVHRGWARPFVDNVWLRRIAEAEAPDVLFSMASIAAPTRLPQLVLFHWPYAIYPEPEVWENMPVRERRSRRVRRWLFGRRARYASHFAAQTETASRRLQQHWGLQNVSVVPNAVSLGEGPASGPPPSLPARLQDPGTRLLLCLTRYYPHKNLEILVALARLMRDAGAPFVVLLTVSPDEAPEASKLLETIRREGLQDILVNLGTIPMDQIPGLYRACAGLLLPTILESFSGTYVESMHFGRPVFTSDRDFARDVCGGAAWYFDPHDAESIWQTIQRAFDAPDEMQRRTQLGHERCEGFPGWREVAADYVALLERVAREGAR